MPYKSRTNIQIVYLLIQQVLQLNETWNRQIVSSHKQYRNASSGGTSVEIIPHKSHACNPFVVISAVQ